MISINLSRKQRENYKKVMEDTMSFHDLEIIIKKNHNRIGGFNLEDESSLPLDIVGKVLHEKKLKNSDNVFSDEYVEKIVHLYNKIYDNIDIIKEKMPSIKDKEINLDWINTYLLK